VAGCCARFATRLCAACKRSTLFHSNLPGALDRFVGRALELREVKERLAQARLLTLLGPVEQQDAFGSASGEDLLLDYEDRVYFVDLASSRDSERCLRRLARTIGLRERVTNRCSKRSRVKSESQRIAVSRSII